MKGYRQSSRPWFPPSAPSISSSQPRPIMMPRAVSQGSRPGLSPCLITLKPTHTIRLMCLIKLSRPGIPFGTSHAHVASAWLALYREHDEHMTSSKWFICELNACLGLRWGVPVFFPFIPFAIPLTPVHVHIAPTSHPHHTHITPTSRPRMPHLQHTLSHA